MTGSRIIAWLLGAAVATIPVAPPEHVHDAHDEGHHHVVLHRHWQPHELHDRTLGQPPALEDHDDDPILTLAVVYTATPRALLSSPLPVVVGSVEPSLVDRSSWRTDEVDLLIHGPPRASTSLRAPPILSRLT